MSIKTLTANILSKIPKIDKWQEKFIIHLFWLLISMRGRVNFEQLGRYSKYNESTFRNNFDKSFDFLSFNQKLIETVCEKEIAIAFTFLRILTIHLIFEYTRYLKIKIYLD